MLFDAHNRAIRTPATQRKPFPDCPTEGKRATNAEQMKPD
jgi:hypothetical protein